MAKVYEQTNPMPCRFQIIVNLRPVFIGQFLHRLQIHYQLMEANEVGLKFRPQLLALVFEL